MQLVPGDPRLRRIAVGVGSRQPPAAAQPDAARVRAHGKFFRVGGEKWFVKGFTYGPFAPNRDGEHLPERAAMAADFAQIRALGANCIRLYHVPTRQLLDDALVNDLRVFLDVPWEKHRCFFEDWSAQDDARQRIRKTARLLGCHPATFAISVANEIPKDIVRYYGHRKVERFVDDLIDIVKQEAPNCLATYTNYPSTEFLRLERPDFTCFNVYLEDPEKLSAYLDRLQHVADSKPLILGEFGVDTIRKGEAEQARQIATHVKKVFRHGLAGSFVFSYTDDWFTGGHQIEDWAFGVTDKDRKPKIAAAALSDLWEKAPFVEPIQLPKASVVVCSYNGARTLDECLESLTKLNYPDYEVILVDDGSKDNTRSIAKRYPDVKYIHQTNHGLSVARNVGAQAATGEVVVYTDSDCVADEDWLRYMMTTMVEHRLDAVGGPNVPPPSDGWTARCVAASPGGPSHVMADDRNAEHIPGCNMAFRRDKLLAIGGFDPQFRAAGDDVDVCWRWQDKGWSIGYAPAALVWHHRRNTIRAFFKQQAGYGEAEAMLHVKHPHRFNRLGNAKWKGIIYGEGAVGLPVNEPAIHHGRFGEGLFQILYRRNDYSAWGYLTLLEWHALAGFLVLLALLWPWLAVVPALMWTATFAAAVRSVRRVAIPSHAPFWVRLVVFLMHVMQPIVRARHRYRHRWAGKRLPHVPADNRLSQGYIKRVSRRRADLYWTSEDNRGREELMAALQDETARLNVESNYECDWATWDCHLAGDAWHDVVIHTATEELGWPKKFTRARCTLSVTTLAAAVVTGLALWTGLALAVEQWYAALAGGAMLLGVLGRLLLSERQCLRTASRLLWRAGHRAKLQNVAARRVRERDGAAVLVGKPELASS